MTVSILEMRSLVSAGLVIEKRHPSLPLAMFKYHNKVFYDNLWHVDPILLEARGIVFDTNTGDIVQRPIHKCFNVGENGTEMPDLGVVDAVRKVNGFMCAVTTYKGNPLVTTTGSFESSYQELAEEYVEGVLDHHPPETATWTFEICDPSDPHIVEEDYGIYLLTSRLVDTGEYATQDFCDFIAYSLGCKRPEVEQFDPDAEHEGWMFYDTVGTPITKLKTPHYLSKKALMRMGKKQVYNMYNNREEFIKRLDEEFYSLYDFLTAVYTEAEYSALTEQERRKVIEEYFND